MFDLKARCIIISFSLFSRSVVSDSATPRHAAGFSVLLCLSPSPWVYSNSCSLSQWCHPTISSSVAPFSSCPQSSPASGSSPVSQLFASGDQSVGPSASAPVLLMSIQGWFPFGLSPCSQRDWCPAPQFEGISSSVLSLFYCQLSHLYMTTGKTIALTIWTFAHKMMSLLFSTLSSFVIAVLPSTKRLLILWLQSPSALILQPKKRKSNAVSMFSPSICYEVKD